MENLVLEIKQLAKRYGKQQALADFDLTVEAGDIIGVAGRNGAGRQPCFASLLALPRSIKGLSAFLARLLTRN